MTINEYKNEIIKLKKKILKTLSKKALKTR